MNKLLLSRPSEMEPIGAPDDEDLPEAPPASRWEWFFRVVPALDSLRQYSLRTFRFDLVAGLTVAAVALPQAMAYATIAGLPPQYGLYTAIVMTRSEERRV